ARLQRRASEMLVAILDRVIDGAPVGARAQSHGGRFVPPAGLHTLRRARENFERLAHARPAEEPPAEEVVADSHVVGVWPTRREERRVAPGARARTATAIAGLRAKGPRAEGPRVP